MNIETVSISPGAETHIPGQIELDDKDSTSGLYQKILYVRLFRPDNADYLQLNTQQTQLNIAFDSLDYNALNNAKSHLKAKLSNRSGMVIIEFPEPVHLIAIEILASKGVDTSNKILIHRVDGEAISEQASATAQYKYINELVTAGSKQESGMKGQNEITILENNAKQKAAPYSEPVYRYSCTIKGSIFALKLIKANKQIQEGFNTNWLTGLHISSKPNSPRISLVAPEFDEDLQQFSLDKGTASLLTLQAGELGSEETPNPGIISLQESLSQTIQSTLQRLQPILKDHSEQQVIDFKLIVNSGTPCRATLSDLSILYSAAKQCPINEQTEKTSLKFNGNLQTPQEITLSIPQTTEIHKAVLEVDQSFNKSDSLSSVTPDRLETLTQIIQPNQGINGNTDESISQPFNLDSPCILKGIQLALTSLDNRTRCSLLVINDRNNKPDGDTLLTISDITLDTQLAKWTALKISEKILLDSGHYWLVLKVHQGQLIWHINDQISQNIQHINTLGITDEFKEVQGLYFLEKDNTFSDSSSNNNQPLLIKIDEAILPVIDRQDTQPETMNRYDLRTALTGQQGPIKLQFFSSQRGMLTVYAPKIIYN